MAKEQGLDMAALRRRFHALRKEVAADDERVGKLRAERDTILSREAEAEAKRIAHIRELEEPLYDKKMELAALVRALKGQTGSPE